MQKRMLSFFVIVAILAMVLSGCAAPAAAPAAPAAPADAAAAPADAAPADAAAAPADAAAAPAGDNATIDVWHIQTQTPEQIQSSADRFMADNPGVDVEVSVLANDAYKTKIKVALGAGNAPCIFPTWGGGPLYEYLKAGQVVDLTPYMEMDNYKDRFVPASLSNVTFEDKVWGVPVENSAIAVIWYNKVMFEELGLTPPATWSEMLTVIDTLKTNDIIPFALANKGKWAASIYYMYLVDRLGGPDVFAKAATRTGGSFEDPVFVEAGKMVQDLVNMGAFNEGFNGADYDTGLSRQLLYSGKAAMELMGNWQIPSMSSENPDFLANNLAFFPFPAIEGGKGDPSNVVGTVGDNYYSISTACKNPDEAFKLIQYMIDDEAVTQRASTGRIPPVKGFTTEDPALQEIIDLIGNAASVQLWYDQYLPSELGEVHKDTMQALFEGEITPEQAATQQEEATVKFYGN